MKKTWWLVLALVSVGIVNSAGGDKGQNNVLATQAVYYLAEYNGHPALILEHNGEKIVLYSYMSSTNYGVTSVSLEIIKTQEEFDFYVKKADKVIELSSQDKQIIIDAATLRKKGPNWLQFEDERSVAFYSGLMRIFGQYLMPLSKEEKQWKLLLVNIMIALPSF